MATTNSLILTMTDSGAGCLKAAGLADRVAGIDYRLVTGPVPFVSDPFAFFAEREKLGRLEDPCWHESGPSSQLCDGSRDVMQFANEFDRIEIWVDPDPNSQLLLFQWLDWLGHWPSLIRRVSLASPDFSIGARTPESVAALGLRAQEITDIQVQTARLSLRAFQQPTPEAWFALLHENLETLPYARATVDQMLRELPAVDTALTCSETRLLEIISSGSVGPMATIADYYRNTPVRVLDYWELGKKLHGLAECTAPAILGLLGGPFDLDLHDDRERFERYKRSKLSLSALGRALLKQQADFSRHNTINRWWGGTRLTNDRLWRWDVVNGVLIPPVDEGLYVLFKNEQDVHLFERLAFMARRESR